MEQLLFYIPYEITLQIAEKYNININQIKSQHIIGIELPCKHIGKNDDILHCWIQTTNKPSDWFRAEIHFFIELRRLEKSGKLPSTQGYINWWKEYVKAMSEEEIEVKDIVINNINSLNSLLNRLRKT
jgi:hypothetical protein